MKTERVRRGISEKERETLRSVFELHRWTIGIRLELQKSAHKLRSEYIMRPLWEHRPIFKF